MLSKERQMEVLEAFDLTKSFRAAAQLTGVDHHTVKRLVTGRALGTELVADAGSPALTDVASLNHRLHRNINSAMTYEPPIDLLIGRSAQ